MRKILTIMALLLFTVVIVSACNSNSKKKSQYQTVNINIQSEPQSLDPRKALNLADMNVMRMFMEGLTRADQSGIHQLALAEKVIISEDLKTYTFILKDAKWSNGDSITSDDFAYAWKQSLSLAFPSPNAAQLYPITNAQLIKEGKLPISLLGVETPNNKTLVVELNYPTPYFLELTSQPIFFAVNAKVAELNPRWAESAETYVGNGPFQLQEWQHHNQIIAAKNQLYWDAKTVHLKSVKMTMATEETALKMFEQEELHWAGAPYSGISPNAIETLKKSNLLRTNSFLSTYIIRINTRKEPFNHPNIKKSFSLAVNTQEVMDYFEQDNQSPETGLISPILELQKKTYFSDNNKEQALLLFETALEGNTPVDEDLPQVTLSYITGENNHHIAQEIQHQWHKTLGIKVNLAPLESKTYYSQLSTQDYQFTYGSWVADPAAPIHFLTVFQPESKDIHHTYGENPECANEPEQPYLYRDKERSTPPIFHNTMFYLQNKRLKDVVLLNTGTIDFKRAYFDKD